MVRGGRPPPPLTASHVIQPWLMSVRPSVRPSGVQALQGLTAVLLSISNADIEAEARASPALGPRV